MKASELRKSSLDELQKQLMDLLREQFNLRMQRGTGQLSKPSQMKAGRRDIARIKTVMAELTKGATS
ncbi:50S ribosomal protein L29 [Chromatium okenii]|uniref:50S ribosomal protein L29 n=1 Tax=Chromatium okenii TaxID=61644 RepID=UPI00190696C3|nr:50S ribosomal protein L29 [Chromatium okenii]MBK1641578.1 50S ribosomal protein L29 [Chromatium okenii]